MPKFIVLVHATNDSEAEVGRVSLLSGSKHPAAIELKLTRSTAQVYNAQDFIDMTAFNKPHWESGVILDAAGFQASGHANRVTFGDGPGPAVTPGPFQLQNLVSGYWKIELGSMEEAINWAKGIPFKKGGVDIRQLAGPGDFGAEVVKELNARQAEWKKQEEPPK